MRPAVVTAAGLGLVLVGAVPGGAAPSSEVIQGEHVRMVSTADPAAMRNMLPGDVVVWQVSVSAAAPEPGTIDIGLSGRGELPLVVDVRSCAQAWSAGSCASGEDQLATALAPPLDGSLTPLLYADAHAISHIRLEVSVPSNAAPAEDATTVLRVHADGYGDELAATPPGSRESTLPRTGMQLGGAVLLAPAAVLLGVGGGLLAQSRRKGSAA